MIDRPHMPSALQIARAVATVLRAKLADHSAKTVVPTREEAALYLEFADGVF